MKRISSMIIGFAVLVATAGTARAAVEKERIIAEIQAALDNWSKLTCTNIKFDYKGELTEFVSEKQGALLIYFGYDNKSWTRSDAFYSEPRILDDPTAAIVRSVIGLNAYSYDWSIGKEKNKIDIRTAITKLIPMAIGYYVGPDINGRDLTGLITYDSVDYNVSALATLGAQYVYAPNPLGSCVKPDMPPICGKSTTTPDRGITLDNGLPKDLATAQDLGAAKELGTSKDLGKADGKPLALNLCIFHSSPNDLSKGAPYHWEGTIPYYIYLNSVYGRVPGGTPVVYSDGGIKDGSSKADKGGSSGGGDGCCRVSHASDSSAGPGALVLLGLVAGLLVARRRVRRSR